MSNQLRYGLHSWEVDHDGDIALDISTTSGKVHITEPELQEMLKQMGSSPSLSNSSHTIIGGGQDDSHD